MKSKLKIGFIGQGWIGKNYANDFEARGYNVVRYGLEASYAHNKEKIADCDIVFIAVPTPTREGKFDDSIVKGVLSLVGKGKIAVIKSTLLIGRTGKLQKEFPNIFVLHSPEFLSERTAAHDAAHPERNIVGIPIKNEKYKKAAQKVIDVLPSAPFSAITSSAEAEMIKYSHNVHGYIQVVFANIMYDVAEKYDMDWKTLFGAFAADPLMVPRYLNPIDKSGRGAGGNCFVKDFEAFLKLYKAEVKDAQGLKVLQSIRDKNIALLMNSGKSLDKLAEVYGKKYKKGNKK